MVDFTNQLKHPPKTQWPRPPANDKREEEMVPELMERYEVVKKEWLASIAHSSILSALRSRPIDDKHRFADCVCFGTGTGTPSGLRKDLAFATDQLNGIKEVAGQKVALYQIAIFKSIVDGIEKLQGVRPTAHFQESAYNKLDCEFLEALDLTAVDVNSAFDLVNNQSPVYLPEPECRVSIEVKRLDSNVLLSTGGFSTVTGQADTYWTTCGFPSGLMHGGVEGLESCVAYRHAIASSRHWSPMANFAPSQLKRHETAHKSPMLAVRKESLLTGGNEAGNSDVALGGVLGEEKVL